MWRTLLSAGSSIFIKGGASTVIIWILIGIISAMYFSFNYLIGDYKRQLDIANYSYRAAETNSTLLWLDLNASLVKLKEQNDRLEAVKVDLSNVKASRDKIARKYKNIIVPEPSNTPLDLAKGDLERCSKELTFYKNLFEGLNNANR